MKKTKSLAAVLLSLALVFSLCACTQQQTSRLEPTAIEIPTQKATEPVDSVTSVINSMTTEEKVGQLFFARCPDADAAGVVSRYHLGGLILFGRDFEGKTAEEVKSDISSYQSAAKHGLLIGVDEEGGTVVRVSDNPNLRSEAFPSPKNAFLNGGWEAVEQTETEKAQLLTSLGINANMAPVCDVTSNEDSFIFDRSFSGDPNEVSEFVKKTVGIYGENKLGSVMKHFPGYGDNTDTHEDMAYDSKPYSAFQQSDFLPFQAGIAAGADAVMVAHNIVACMDAEVPASLSPKVHEILRSDLNFSGVILTDDLAMEAIQKYAGADAAAVAAVKCGNDMLLCSDVETQYPAVLAAVKNGGITEEQLNASVRRILQWKSRLGLPEQD